MRRGRIGLRLRRRRSSENVFKVKRSSDAEGCMTIALNCERARRDATPPVRWTAVSVAAAAAPLPAGIHKVVEGWTLCVICTGSSSVDRASLRLYRVIREEGSASKLHLSRHLLVEYILFFVSAPSLPLDFSQDSRFYSRCHSMFLQPSSPSLAGTATEAPFRLLRRWRRIPKGVRA